MNIAVKLFLIRATVLFLSLIIGTGGWPTIAEAFERYSKPESAKVKQALKDIHEAYEQDYQNAKEGANQKSELAATLIQAAQVEKDPANQYTLLKEAISLQADARLAEELVETTDLMSQAFEIDGIKIKAYFLNKIAGKTKTKEDSDVLSTTIASVIDQAITADRYDRALELIGSTLAMGNRIRNRKLVRKFEKLDENTRAVRLLFDDVKQAQQILADEPLDADANQTVGEWYCLKRSRWNEGVTYLALGNHPDTKALGRLDLKIDRSPSDEVQLGDLCWDLVEKMPTDSTALKDRAIFWYERAQPQLSGIVAKKIARRIEEWRAENEPPSENDKTKKDEQPKLAKSPMSLTKVKPKKTVAPINPQGIPLWNRNGRVLYGSKPIQIPGKNNLYLHPFPKSRGSSALVYDLGGRYRSFAGGVGVPRVSGYKRSPRSEITFSVILDGKQQEIASTSQRGNKSVTPFSIDITGVKQLVLVTSCSGNPEGCFAFWFNPVVSPKEFTETPQEEDGPK